MIERSQARPRVRYRTSTRSPTRSRRSTAPPGRSRCAALIDMAADRGCLHRPEPVAQPVHGERRPSASSARCTCYAWKAGLKTTYYLRSRPATRINQTTTSGGGGTTTGGQRVLVDAARPRRRSPRRRPWPARSRTPSRARRATEPSCRPTPTALSDHNPDPARSRRERPPPTSETDTNSWRWLTTTRTPHSRTSRSTSTVTANQPHPLSPAARQSSTLGSISRCDPCGIRSSMTCTATPSRTPGR